MDESSSEGDSHSTRSSGAGSKKRKRAACPADGARATAWWGFLLIVGRFVHGAPCNAKGCASQPAYCTRRLVTQLAPLAALKLCCASPLHIFSPSLPRRPNDAVPWGQSHSEEGVAGWRTCCWSARACRHAAPSWRPATRAWCAPHVLPLLKHCQFMCALPTQLLGTHYCAVAPGFDDDDAVTAISCRDM